MPTIPVTMEGKTIKHWTGWPSANYVIAVESGLVLFWRYRNSALDVIGKDVSEP